MAQALITINAVTGSNPPNGTALVIDTVVALDNINNLFFSWGMEVSEQTIACLLAVVRAEEQYRFWSYVSPPTSNGCRLWLGEKGWTGHGRFLFLGVRTAAHRRSYELYRGEIPTDYKVCHTCDVPDCVQPEHLFVGTQKDNVQDCVRKNRKPRGDNHWSRREPSLVSRGEKAGNSKLKEAEVLQIWESRTHESLTQTSKRFRVSVCTVRSIQSGKTWRHITEGQNG